VCVWLFKLSDQTSLLISIGIGALVVAIELARWGWRQVRAS
jgi:hypothetical protein